MAEAKPPRQIPWAPIVACLSFITGVSLSCWGVLLLAGVGWAVLVAALPFLALSAVIFRGLLHGK